jgi:hypothetical protein
MALSRQELVRVPLDQSGEPFLQTERDSDKLFTW